MFIHKDRVSRKILIMHIVWDSYTTLYIILTFKLRPSYEVWADKKYELLMLLYFQVN